MVEDPRSPLPAAHEGVAAVAVGRRLAGVDVRVERSGELVDAAGEPVYLAIDHQHAHGGDDTAERPDHRRHAGHDLENFHTRIMVQALPPGQGVPWRSAAASLERLGRSAVADGPRRDNGG